MRLNQFLLGIAAAIAIFLAHAWLYRDFFIDDAYISLRFVQQWLAGNGIVYNQGEFVEGYSNFLWVVLLTLSGAVGIDLVLATRLWGVGFCVATLFAVGLQTRSFKFPFMAPLFLAISVPFAAWSAGGLENPLFMFLVSAGALLFWREETQGKGWASAVCWGLLALTRPDGIVFVAVAFVYRVVQLFGRREWPYRHDYVRGAIVAGFVLGHLAWRLSYYGYLLPNTFYAKSVGLSLRAFLEGGYYTFLSAEILGGYFLYALLIVLAFSARARYPFVTYFGVTVGAYLLFVILAGGDWMPAQRFLTAVLPLVAILVHVGAMELASILSGRIHPKLVWSLVAGHLLYMVAIGATLLFLESIIPSGHRLSDTISWVDYLVRHVEQDETVAVQDAGVVAYKLPLSVRIVDMVGLVDEHIAHRSPEFPGGLWGRGDAWGRWDVDYVLAQEPRFIQITGSPDSHGVWRSGFTGSELLANDPRFAQLYRETEVRGLFERIRVSNPSYQ